MSVDTPTFRDADGERVFGTRRSVFIRDGDSSHLSDPVVYADGLVDCWGRVTVEGFARTLRSGRVATGFEEGTRASLHGVVAWRCADPRSATDAESLLGEVRGEIGRLNGRPDPRRGAGLLRA